MHNAALTSLAWPPVRTTDQEALVRLVVPYVRWLDPELVATLASDTTAHLAAWQAVLRQKHILPDFYVWPGSACAFPGIRRRAGQLAENHCLVFDHNGNRYAHRVWELLGSSVTQFKAERAGYELVHLLPHQPTEWQKLFGLHAQQLQGVPPEWRLRLTTVGLPALFTSLGNMCFLPGIMVRPTDGNSLLRQVLWKKAFTLYESQTLLPPGLAQPLEQWLYTLPDLSDLPWSEQYHGSRSQLHNLLADRHKHLVQYQRA